MQSFKQKYSWLPKAVWWKRYEPDVDIEFNIGSLDERDYFKAADDLYIRRNTFDCAMNGKSREGIEQPLKGLMLNGNKLSVRTMYFSGRKYEPKTDDKVWYRGKMWNISNAEHEPVALPRERYFLHIELEMISSDENQQEVNNENPQNTEQAFST